MVIYGVALLAFCMLTGVFLGDLLGQLIGVQANVGGVGLSMLLLIVLVNQKHQRFNISVPTEKGINFWNAMYVPIVVAMAARQDVAGATEGGLLAVVAGVAAVTVSFALVPILSKIGNKTSTEEN